MTSTETSPPDGRWVEARGAGNRAASPRREHDWKLLGAVGLFLTVLYVAAPYGPFAGAVYVAASLFAAAAVALAVRRRPRPFRPTAWVLLACALALVSVGHVIWYWLDLHGLEPFPSLADAFYLGVYPF